MDSEVFWRGTLNSLLPHVQRLRLNAVFGVRVDSPTIDANLPAFSHAQNDFSASTGVIAELTL